MEMKEKEKFYQDITVEEDLIQLDLSKGIELDERKYIKKDEGIIKDCYVCVRPGNRQDVPKVYKQETNSRRTVVNNYGHGGIGWSTVWGSVIKSIEMVKEKLIQSSKIAVVGMGCVGCATALMLVNNGVDSSNIEIFCESQEDLTSHKSGAFLSAASVLKEIDKEAYDWYQQVNTDSFKMWDKIEKGLLFPKLKLGVKKVKAYFGAEPEWGTVMTNSALDIFVDNGLIPEPELVCLKFNNKLNLMKKYDSFYFNTFKLMKAFYDIIENDHKIKVNWVKIKSFDEIDSKFDTIFNCSGLGSMELQKDEDILPVAGHIITLKHQMIEKMNYVIYSHYIHKEDIGKYTNANAPLFYFMPKTDDKTYGGLLGGSFYPNYLGGEDEIDQCEYRGIMKRTMEIFGIDERTVYR